MLDVKKLNSDGLQAFALANTGSDQFAAGALAMLELLEATLGRPLNVCADSDPKFVALASSQRVEASESGERLEAAATANSASSESTS